MDTHLHPNPSRAAPRGETMPRIDLPERAEAPAAGPDGLAPDGTPARRPVALRTWLLAGGAAAGILGMIGTGIVYSLSHTRSPTHQGNDWVGMPQAVSPQRPPGQSAQPMSGAPAGARQPAVQGFDTPRGSDASRPADTQPGLLAAPAPASAADDLRSLKQPGPSTLATPRPQAGPTTPLAPASGEAATSSVAPQGKAMAASQAPASVTAAPASDRMSVPAPPDPQDPMDVIGRVTELAGEIAQERQEDADLRHQLAQLLVDTDIRFSEFERRLSQAETGTPPVRARAVSERMPATFAPPAIPVAMSSAGRPSAPVAAPLPAGARRYEIRAASPGVAVLGTLDGTPAVIEIGLGYQVPGYGRVNAIVQKGSAWAVQCERGTIQ